MNEILERLKREPALILALVGALISLGLAFGLDLSKEQQTAITAAIVAVVAIITRSQVTPNASVAAKEAEAIKADAESRELVAGKASSVPEGEPVTVVPEGVVETQHDAALPPKQTELL